MIEKEGPRGVSAWFRVANIAQTCQAQVLGHAVGQKSPGPVIFDR